ncbi:hypothetical protein [Aquifex sp.]
MGAFLVFLSLIVITFGVNLQEDLKTMEKLEKELSTLRNSFKEEGITLNRVDELNRLGYPIYTLYEKYKYLKEKDKKYEKVYERAKLLQEKYFLIKREIFPHFVMEDARRNNLKVCSVEVEGKDKRKIVVRIEQPEKDEEIRKVYESTQLYYADRLGFEVIDFRKCRE